MNTPGERAAAIAHALAALTPVARLDGLACRDAGHGYDEFGLHPAWVRAAVAAAAPVYQRYFRVESFGAQNIPPRGPVVLAANHGGLLPIDGMMLWTDVLLHTQPPRVPRAVADNFVARLPVVGTLFQRAGVVGGSRGNVHALLERGELVMIFPEGTAGVGKLYRERYQLRDWHVGHAEMALRHRAPVVPVGIVGPDEQWPFAARLPLRVFGAPYVPVSALPLPLPVRYRVRYGTPIALHEEFAGASPDDPDALAHAAARVRSAVAGLIDQTLAARPGVFR